MRVHLDVPRASTSRARSITTKGFPYHDATSSGATGPSCDALRDMVSHELRTLGTSSVLRTRGERVGEGREPEYGSCE